MDTQNLTFSYSVSTREYNRNKDERQTPFLQWQEKQGTIKDLESDIKNGFAFCPTFNHDGATFTNRAKTKTNLKATYFITFDFDAVKLTAGQFYGSMIGTGLTPSMVYTTANNGNFKQGKNETYCNRYRVIYLIDEPITTAEDYTAIHTALKTEIAHTVNDTNIFNDTTDKDVSHFYAGCKDTDAYSNNSVISLSWLADRYSIELVGIRTRSNDCCIETISSHADTSKEIVETQKGQKCGNGGLYGKREKVLYNGSHKNDPFSKVWDEFTKDYEQQANTFNRLAFAYRGRLPMLPTATDLTPYINETNKDKLYIDVDGDFTELVYRRVKVSKRDRNGEMVERWENAKFCDGMARRRKLFLHCLLLRHITPTATRVQILWNAVNFMVDYIDNAQDPITKYEVSRIVDNAMSKDLQQWQQVKQRFSKTFKVNKTVAAQRDIKPKQAALKARNERATDRKTEKWERIAAIFDPIKTNQENLKALADNGTNITPSYLQEWKRENGFTMQGKRSKAELIATHYDPTLTDGQNVEQLAANGVKVSLKTFKRWKTENGFTKPRAKAENNPNKDREGVFNGTVEDLPTNETTCKQGANMGCFSSLDIDELANGFLNCGNAEHKNVKKSETSQDFDPWQFYQSHNLEGARYGKDVVKDREELETFKRENRAKGIDPNAMSEEDFLTWLCTENEQAETTSSTCSTVEEDEPF